MTRRDRRPTSNRGVNITRRLRKTELHQLETASHISAEGTIPVWRRLRLSHKCGTIFLRITNGMTGRPSPVAQRLPADRSESHLPPEDFSTVIEGTSQHTSAIYSFRICATPVAHKGRGRIFYSAEKCECRRPLKRGLPGQARRGRWGGNDREGTPIGQQLRRLV